MRIEDLDDTGQATLAELDGIALRLFGPRTYTQLTDDEQADVVWQSIRDLCGTFTPPYDPGEHRPEGWWTT